MEIYSEIYSCYRLFHMCTRPKVIGDIHDVGSIHRSKIAYFLPMIDPNALKRLHKKKKKKKRTKI